jgi:hypothetical protein
MYGVIERFDHVRTYTYIINACSYDHQYDHGVQRSKTDRELQLHRSIIYIKTLINM